jgi:hypothetical protein
MIAKDLKPGDVITRAGHTTHSPITVTRAVVSGPYVVVYGFNSRDTTPRLMFRHLDRTLPITVEPRKELKAS